MNDIATNHYFDAEGVYVGSAPANPGADRPANALRAAPPRRDGQWPALNAAGDGWLLLEDHRGRAGWFDGEPAIIDTLGPLPKGWSDSPPSAGDARPPAERRAEAYRATADPHRDAVLGYRLEAEAWELAGDPERAAQATAKAAEHLGLYLERKRAIRLLHPETAAGETRGDDGESNGGGERFYLTNAGTYHREGCAYTTAAGEWLPLDHIPVRRAKARPCGRCGPPLPAPAGK